jgi:formylglycine-generating enzyme required for sulfatase activity
MVIRPAGEPLKIEAQPGKHVVIVKRGDDLLVGETVILQSGKESKIVVRYEPPSSVTNSIGLRLILIPAGAFLMGSPGDDNETDSDETPQHDVRLSAST